MNCAACAACVAPGLARPPTALRERGSATIVLIGVVGVIASLLLAGLTLTRVHLAHSQARTAADLGALAGASAAVQGGRPCAAAGAVVRRNDGALAACRADGAVVTVTAAVGSGLPGLGPVEVSARAGPAGAR